MVEHKSIQEMTAESIAAMSSATTATIHSGCGQD